MNTIINVECVDQDLIITNAPTLASGGICENVVSFKFCNKWDDFNKTAVFYQNEKNVYYALINSQNECEIPHEVTLNEGTLYIGVFGVKGDTRRTSKVDKIRIHKGAWTKDMHPSDPTPDIYTQLLSELKEVDDLLKGFLNGTYKTPVGNAKTLEGHGSDYFATAESVANIQTTSTATVGGIGWYRVAEITNSPDNYVGSFRIVARYGYGGGITATFSVERLNDKFKIKPTGITTISEFPITKVRLTSNGTSNYFEIYYSLDRNNVCTFSVNAISARYGTYTTWKALDFIPTSETVDGVTVTTTYDIPANASPVTDLDLVPYKGEWLRTSILEKALTLDEGVYNYRFKSTYDASVDMPNSMYMYGSATVYVREKGSVVCVVLHGYNKKYPETINYYGGVWSGWNTFASTADLENYLPKSGGQIDATSGIPLGLNTQKDYSLIEFKKNDTRTGCIGISDNKPTFLDTNGNWRELLHSGGGTVGTGSLNEPLKIKGTTSAMLGMYNSSGSALGYFGITAGNKPIYQGTDNIGREILHSGNVGTYALPISGGTIESTNNTLLGLKTTTGNTTLIAFNGTNGKLGGLGFYGTDNPIYQPSTGGTKSLHHDGNSAKVLVQSTPLTQEGSIRVW